MDGLEIELFDCATHGRPYLRTTEELDDAVAHFEPDLNPAKIGHNQPGEEANGWIASVRRQGTKLFGTLTHVSEALKEKVRTKALRNRSCEFRKTADGWRLRGVAFLGASIPECKGLSPIPEFSEDGTTIFFQEGVGIFAERLIESDSWQGHWHMVMTDDAGNGATGGPITRNSLADGQREIDQDGHTHNVLAYVIQAAMDDNDKEHRHGLTVRTGPEFYSDPKPAATLGEQGDKDMSKELEQRIKDLETENAELHEQVAKFQEDTRFTELTRERDTLKTTVDEQKVRIAAFEEAAEERRQADIAREGQGWFTELVKDGRATEAHREMLLAAFSQDDRKAAQKAFEAAKGWPKVVEFGTQKHEPAPKSGDTDVTENSVAKRAEEIAKERNISLSEATTVAFREANGQ